MRFVHLTDTHIKNEYLNEGFEKLFYGTQNPIIQLSDVLSEINWTNIDFLVVTGDLVHEGDSDDYKLLNSIIRNHLGEDFKIIYCLGNHDHKTEFYKGILGIDKGNESYYFTEDLQGYRLIVLDSAVPGNESGTVSQEQLDWLKNIFKEDSEKGSLIFLHHPVIWNSDDDDVHLNTNHKEILDVLKTGDVIAVFCGHTHHNALCMKEGIIQVTGDATSFSLSRKKPGYIAVDDKAGYNLVEIDQGVLNVHSEVLTSQNILKEMSLEAYEKTMKELDTNLERS